MDTLTEQAELAELAEVAEVASGAVHTRQFVTFMAGGEVFAVDMAPVQEIIRVPQVVRVPLAPPSLNGLANLRGKVLPIVSLRRTLGLEEHEYDDSARAIVVGSGQSMGFVVDRVVSVVGVDSRQIEGVEGIEATISTDLLSGLLKDVAGHPMIMVLDVMRLMALEFAASTLAASRLSSAVGAGAAALQNVVQQQDELHLVSFDVARQEYAIAISAVQEIVQMPEHVVQVPRAQAHVLGLMTLRNRLLPLVSLRRMFGLPAVGQDERSRIVVVALAGGSVGIVVDNVNEVLRVPTSQVEAMPALLAGDRQLAELSHICRLNDGQRLVSVMSTDQLFQHTAFREAMESMAQAEQAAGSGAQVGVRRADLQNEYELLVVFRLGAEEFGVPIASVQEIVRVPATLTQVPQAPSAVEGVINLRGVVLTVVDLRRRLGLDSVERNDGQRIIVLLIDGTRTGFIVDAVAEVLKVPCSAIEPAPQLSADQAQLLARMVNLEQHNRLLQLIEPQHLLQGAVLREALAAASAGAGHA